MGDVSDTRQQEDCGEMPGQKQEVPHKAWLQYRLIKHAVLPASPVLCFYLLPSTVNYKLTHLKQKGGVAQAVCVL